MDNSGATYTCELATAVTALWCSALLLDVKVTELTTWGLDDTGQVGLGVVSDGIRSAGRVRVRDCVCGCGL